MNLNINVNRDRSPEVWKQGGADGATGAGEAGRQDIRTPANLTIQTATASPEDIAAAEIPDSALTRDDSLGKLVLSAFNLPPPPMPDFGKADV